MPLLPVLDPLALKVRGQQTKTNKSYNKMEPLRLKIPVLHALVPSLQPRCAWKDRASHVGKEPRAPRANVDTGLAAAGMGLMRRTQPRGLWGARGQSLGSACPLLCALCREGTLHSLSYANSGFGMGRREAVPDLLLCLRSRC